MIDIACAIVAAVAMIICALIAKQSKQRDKAIIENQNAQKDAIAQRAADSFLLLKMMNAVCDLTVGTALALKRGRCNGELDRGLENVQEAQVEYSDFLTKIAQEQLVK